MSQVQCDICGAPMEFVKRLQTKKTWRMIRYRCIIDPGHERTIMTDDYSEVSRFMADCERELKKLN